MSTILFDKIVFGPIHSRRLGVSLGMNLLPTDGKLCSFNCIYCECGLNENHRTHSKLPTRTEVREALEQKLSSMKAEGIAPDVITFAGNGEPTIHPEFGGIIDDTVAIRDRFFPDAKIAVLSNSTMLHKEEVFVGNSITHGGHYHSFIWLYYMTRFPDQPITIMNAGIGGESAWDIKDRLDYDVFDRKPTYVTLTFGMNDTGYDVYMKDNAKELSEERIAKSLESYREIEERLLAKNRITKVLIGGSPYDETSRFNHFILHGKNDAILKIIDAQRASAKKNDWGSGAVGVGRFNAG